MTGVSRGRGVQIHILKKKLGCIIGLFLGPHEPDQTHFLGNIHRTLSFVQKQFYRVTLNGTDLCGFDMFLSLTCHFKNTMLVSGCSKTDAMQ